MEYRNLGKSGFKVSALGFGCGGVGGLMVDGEFNEMIRVVERALEAGINYFDTAQIYGGGLSETNLGRVMEVLKPEAIIGTKVQLQQADMEHIEESIIKAVEISLRRLKTEQIQLFQLHNGIEAKYNPALNRISINDLESAIQALEKLQAVGKIKSWGINGLGESDILRQVVAESGASTIQICYNLLNPSAGQSMPTGFPFQDYLELIDHAAKVEMGVIAFRVMAGGALTGKKSRHPLAASAVSPIATGQDYATDVAQALTFKHLVTEGWVGSMPEAAIRFAISNINVSTALVGISSMDQLEQAIASAEQGSLPAEVIEQLPIVRI